MPPRSAIAPAAGWSVAALLALIAAGGAAAGTHGVALGLPGPVPALLVLAGVALVAVGRLEHGRLALGLLPLLAAVLLSPWLPGARALTGAPLAAGLLALAVLVLARRPPACAARVFFPTVLLIYFAVAWNVQRHVGAEGDEPHYLMVAESLLRDGDLALEQDYAAGRYRTFYRTRPTLAPHYLVRGREGEIYSQQALGLSLLVLPAYAAGGYAAAGFFMALLGALLAREVRLLLREWTGDAGLAEGVAWAAALSPPLVHFAGLVFTEIPAALGLALALRRLREPGRLSVPAALGVGAALAFLPWLNVRYAAFPVILLLYALAGRPRVRVALALVLPSAVAALASALYHFQLYGFFDPRRVYGKRPGFAWTRLPGGLEALALDQEFGLLVYAPVFVLALAGFVACVRRERWRDVAAAGLPIAVVLATAATWRMWWGGFTPPARFLVPVVPALALLVAWALRRGLTSGAALLLGWGLWLGLGAVAQPQLVHRDRDGTAPLLRALSGGEEWTRLLPAFVRPEPDPRQDHLALVWALALGATLLVSARAKRSSEAPRPAGLAAAMLGWLVAAGVAAQLSGGHTGGRDAVRVIGRPALELPALRFTARAVARWGPEALGWGGVYEAHRFPAGAPIGSRLPLPPGRYRLWLDAEAPPGARPPALSVVPDKAPPTAARRQRLTPAADGLVGEFDVAPGTPAVDVRLHGGGPLRLKNLRLELQP